jgi:hypothetical protein
VLRFPYGKAATGILIAKKASNFIKLYENNLML